MKKVVTTEQALKITTPVVFVTGSFDLLHQGHEYFLRKAKGIVGDSGSLLVAVLSDNDIKVRKGESRPILDQNSRVKSVSDLIEVDYVIPWENKWEELKDFVIELKPKYLAVVEGDPGLENKQNVITSIGGEMVVFPRLKGYSTTRIIENEELL